MVKEIFIIGGTWEGLAEKTSNEIEIGAKRKKVSSKYDPNTNRIIDPRLNEEEIVIQKKRKPESLGSLLNFNFILGEGPNQMDDRKEIARNRQIKTIHNYEQNSRWWNNDTPAIVSQLKEAVGYDSNIDYAHYEEYIDPRLQIKLDKMHSAKLELEKNRDFSPLVGGVSKPLCTGKKISHSNVMRSSEDILCQHSVTTSIREKRERRYRRRAPDPEIYNQENKNGWIEYRSKSGLSEYTGKTETRSRSTIRRHPAPIRNLSTNMELCLAPPLAPSVSQSPPPFPRKSYHRRKAHHSVYRSSFIIS